MMSALNNKTKNVNKIVRWFVRSFVRRLSKRYDWDHNKTDWLRLPKHWVCPVVQVVWIKCVRLFISNHRKLSLMNVWMCLGRFSIELNMRKVIKRKLKQTNEQAERTEKKPYIHEQQQRSSHEKYKRNRW